MALAIIANGTQTAIIGTEHALDTDETGRTYVLSVDTKNMVNSDKLELRMKIKTLSGSTSALAYLVTYEHVQSLIVKISIPIPALHQIVVTLKQTAGTGRTYEWELLSLD